MSDTTDELLVAVAPLHVVEVTGQDRTTYLDDVLTQKLDDVRAGQVFGALELDAHGTILLSMDVVVLADRVLLLLPAEAPRPDTPPPMTPPGQPKPDMPDLAAAAVARLGSRTFLKDARFRRRDDLHVVSLVGAGLDVAAGHAGPRGRMVPGPTAGSDGDVVVQRHGWHDVVTASPDAIVAEHVDAGARVGDHADWHAARVAHGVPGWTGEAGAGHLPEEVGLLPTHVHLEKGCYPGQEAVARQWMLGRPRRQFARLVVDEGVGAGWTTGSGKRAVTVTTLGSDGAALGFVPADASPGSRLAAEDGTGVTVAAIVGADRPVPGHNPAATRRRDR